MRTRRGFTLIELLVVIAIIAILVALLLPAVQAVREAARRSQCQDHLHNIVIGLHNYEGTHKLFPPGNIGQIVHDTRQPNWMLLLLPSIEQKPAYDQFVVEGFNLSGQGTPPLGAANALILNQLRVDLYNCPSSPMDETEATAINDGSPGGSVQLVNYVGISGSYVSGVDLVTPPTPVDNVYGVGAYNGVLIPANSRGKKVKMANLVDGTSNVVVVGEQSNFVGGTADRRACGHRNGSWASGPASPHLGDYWRQSLTTYRHPINPKTTSLAGGNNPYEQNTPFTSAHPGGAQFALGDGVVTFISENVNDGVMIRLCDKQDGQPVGPY